MYLLSIIPSSLSNLAKEATFKGIVVDMWHLQTMVCIGQLVSCIVLAPLAAFFVRLRAGAPHSPHSSRQ